MRTSITQRTVMCAVQNCNQIASRQYTRRKWRSKITRKIANVSISVIRMLLALRCNIMDIIKFDPKDTGSDSDFVASSVDLFSFHESSHGVGEPKKNQN